jgi:hypothetical protein
MLHSEVHDAGQCTNRVISLGTTCPCVTSVIIASAGFLNDTVIHNRMIFGFNTDIKHEETIYHVQSEAREGEMLLQTQVFVRGRCIGKRATPYAEQAKSPGFTDQQKESILREQHRLVLDAIRDGKLEQVFDKKESPETLAAIKELDIHWINADSVHADEKLSMKLRATEGEQGIANARLTVRLARVNAAPFYTQVLTDNSGEADVVFMVDESSLADSSVLVQVNAEGRTATRKFQLRRVEA